MGNHISNNSNSEKNILVTGGGGFLGNAIVKKLVERGDNVRSFSRGHYDSLEKAGVEQFHGDISNKPAVVAASKNVDIIFHTAAKPGVWGKYADFYETNVVGTQNIIDACKINDIPYLIHTSSPSVIFDGTDMEGVDESVPYPKTYHCDYPKTKAMAEKSVLEAAKDGLKTIILRPHLIWGPEDNHLVPRIISRAESIAQVGNGKNLVDTIYIDNAADAHIAAADSLIKKPELTGNLYFISQDKPLPLWDMVNAILMAGGKPIIRKSVPAGIALAIGTILEFIYKTLRLKGEPKMTRFVAKELATAHWFDISAAKQDLGYKPKISTEEGLDRLEKWLKRRTTEK
ncbi:MAG: NAD-dependent epimerase/dehydratase family protein [Desulfobacterales bacterium]|nr:NAD-dependent epimerase/dehydratase family protein [Desulfobacterales bacterium]